jgi:methylated-DNA-[protein]-cysteine S-methyltransferase
MMNTGNIKNIDSMLTDCSPFQRKVLLATLNIPIGSTETYASIAKKIGSPKSSRAVGTALANNPYPFIIPCHRVIRTDGKIGNYQGGTEMKRQLLLNEGVKLKN